jgi:HK97 family phage prohead protease
MSRFSALAAALAAKGAHNPDALAAYIGRRKYTPAGMAALAAAGRAKRKAKSAVMGSGGRSLAGVFCVRAFDFRATGRSGGDGRTLEGYAAVFDTPSRIAARDGDFDEVIRPGAFARSLEKRTPVLQFEHGRDPRVGAVPIGAIEDIGEDRQGLHVRARLFDNPVVEPVRQAIAEKAIRGMSFRFAVPDGGDKWSSRRNEVDLREVYDTDTAECGPVVFPAYDTTTVSVRSLLAQLDPAEYDSLIRELRADVLRELRAADLSDLTGRPGARSAGGGDAPPIHTIITQPHRRQRLDDGALRLRGIL